VSSQASRNHREPKSKDPFSSSDDNEEGGAADELPAFGRADGVRLNDDPDRPGHLAGFCWTKVHEPLAPGQPRLGEIYAIGVDPSRHGQGLGVPMTGAGLRWLAGQGLTTGMLYVEADNQPALATYDRIGFRHHRTDRAWHRLAVR
jgi:mycothiol synthase